MFPHCRNILALICLWSIYTFGQKTGSDAIKNYKEKSKWQPYQIYIHLNKKVFIPGETIYFTAYVFNGVELLPASGKMNLDIGLFDGQGKQLKSSVWKIENGITFGSIETDRSYIHGRYYFKGSTRWNLNFSGKGNFIVGIDLIENEIEKDSDVNENARIRFLPEGGNLLNDRINTIGFQIIDSDNKGVAIRKGHIEDVNGEIVLSNVTSNAFGLGRIDLFLERGKSYYYRFEFLDGQVSYGELPSATDEGYSLNTSGPLNQARIVNVQCGTKSFKEARNQRFYLIVHQGKLIKNIPFTMDEQKKSFKMDRAYMAPGVNIISLLDKEFNLLNTRAVFNHHDLQKGETQVVLKSSSADSIYLGIRSRNLLDKKASFSVSVLPDNRRLNRERKTVFDMLYLQPNLDGFAETSPIYYESFDRKSLYYLDILLMIHGKSDFVWGRSAEIVSQPQFLIEFGFTIEGCVKNFAKNKINSIAFYQDRIDKLKIIEIKEDSTFSLQNYPIYEDLPINFVLIDSKGKMQKPMLEMDIFPKKERDSLKLSDRSFVSRELTYEKDDKKNFMQAFEEQSNVLDNVTVIAKGPDKKTTRNMRLNTGFWNAVKISEDQRKKHQVLSRYLRSIGFRVRSIAINNTLIVNARSNSPLVKPPTIYFNGFEMSEPLRDFMLHSIDEIYYEHSGLTRSNGGSIYIYRKNDSRVADRSAPFVSMETDTGFQRPERFMSMINPDGFDDRIKQYMSVHWEPELKINDGSEISFSFPKFGMKNFVVYIEGVTADGWLFSKVVTIEGSDLITDRQF